MKSLKKLSRFQKNALIASLLLFVVVAVLTWLTNRAFKPRDGSQ